MSDVSPRPIAAYRWQVYLALGIMAAVGFVLALSLSALVFWLIGIAGLCALAATLVATKRRHGKA